MLGSVGDKPAIASACQRFMTNIVNNGQQSTIPFVSHNQEATTTMPTSSKSARAIVIHDE